MIPLKILNLYISQINSCSSWGGSPFEWDYHLKKFRRSYNKKRWYMASVYWGCYTIFYTIRLTQCVIMNEYPTVHLLFGLNLLLDVYFLSVAYFILVLRENDSVLQINSSLVYKNYFYGIYSKNPAETNGSFRLLVKMCYSWMRFTGAIIITAAVGFSVITMIDPYSIYSLMNIIPMDYRGNVAWYFVRPVYSLLVFRAVLSSAMSAYAVALTAALSWIVYYQTEDQLNLNTTGYWTKNTLRTPKKLHKEYTALRVLSILQENVSRDYLVWFQMTLTRAVHVCCFLLIRYSHILHTGVVLTVIVSTVGIIVAWIIIMQGASLYHTSTSKIIRSWRKARAEGPLQAKIWKKVRRATKPLGIKVGDHYLVKPMTVVSIVENYFKGTLRLLLTFKAKP